MAKRKRTEGNSISNSPTSPLSNTSRLPQSAFDSRPRPSDLHVSSNRPSLSVDSGGPHQSLNQGHNVAQKNGHGDSSTTSKVPCISRKVKACAACRKQKIKCLMGPGDSPPCQRCKERGLSCQLNKSLQTLMTEDSKWKGSVAKDISILHASVQTILQTLSLPALQSPKVHNQASTMQFDFEQDHEDDEEDDDQSVDHSPRVSPTVDNVNYTQDPIESLYQVTGLKSLRSSDSFTDEQKRLCRQLRDNDFISRGMITLHDAEHLAKYYLTHLDPYLFNMNCQYETLDEFRRRSPTLTAAVLTVAALHDVDAKPELYHLCMREYKRLVANAMFERRIDMEYLRGLVVGSYWLSDIAWTLSGYAIRRASEFHLKTCYYLIADSVRNPNKYTAIQLHEARDGLRLLYLLYICDHHLSILYGRMPILRENEQYLTGYENFLASSVAKDKDKRLGAQISLLLLFSKIRKILGREEDTRTVLSIQSLPSIKTLEGEIENWTSRWANVHNPNRRIGTFPKKGTYLHHYFLKLYLDAHVFRGLSSPSSLQASDIPPAFVETATSAVEAATNMIRLILEDEELKIGLAGVPHYFWGMIAFACVFLVKAATRHGVQLQIDAQEIRNLIESLSDQLGATRVGRGHVIHRMTGGLRKMVDSLGTRDTRGPNLATGIPYSTQMMDFAGANTAVEPAMNPSNAPNLNEFVSMNATELGLGDTNMGFGMPFFDFENTNFDLTTPMYSIPEPGAMQ